MMYKHSSTQHQYSYVLQRGCTSKGTRACTSKAEHGVGHVCPARLRFGVFLYLRAYRRIYAPPSLEHRQRAEEETAACGRQFAVNGLGSSRTRSMLALRLFLADAGCWRRGQTAVSYADISGNSLACELL